MKFGKLEKILLTFCVISVLATVGYYVKDGFKTYTAYTEEDNTQSMIDVRVIGEVENPGSYRMAANSRACDLIYAAGGITNNADVEQVDLDAILTDGMRINVPKIMEYDFDGSPLININKASADELMLVPGIGEELAKRIIEYRTQYGAFSDLSELVRVRGIGDKNFGKIKDYIKTED